MKRILIILTALVLQSSVFVLEAQPQRSRTTRTTNRKPTTAKGKNDAQQQTISRADLMFPTAVQMPEEVVWRRDLYRELDLKENANAPLGFPVRPIGKQMNLCALIFKLVGTGKIPIYKYSRADGYEDFSTENRMHYKELLDQAGVSYDKNATSIKIPDEMLPSEEVVKYFIKESNYFDQNTGTYKAKVTAICPVVKDNSDFSYRDANKPLCWIKYDDIVPYLNSQIIMTSNVNNAATMSMADFFATNHYKGKIYTTSNMQGESLANQVKPDSLGNMPEDGLKKVQDRMEKQMKDFEEHIWKTPVDSAELARRDSIAKLDAKSSKRVIPSNKTRRGQTSTGNVTTQNPTKTKKEKSSKSDNGGSAPARVSVRRQRH